MRKCGFVSALLIGLISLGCATRAQAQSGPRPTITLLPVVNLNGEKWKDLKLAEAKAGNQWLHKEFARRKFQITPEKDVTAALTAKNIDLTDEEQQKKANMYAAAEATGADLAVFSIIDDVKDGPDGLRGKATATIRIWVLDVKEHKAILDGVTVQADHRSNGKSSARQIGSIESAFDKGMKDYLATFPDK